MDAKSIKKGPQKGLGFQGGQVSKIIKIRALGQNMLQASKRGSQAPKILKNHQKKSPRASTLTQNHENLVTKNPENPIKKTSRIQEIKKRHGGGLCAQRTGYIYTYHIYNM